MLKEFVDQWGGFGADGRYRTDSDALFGESLGRPLFAEEGVELELRYDFHELAIRETGRAAYDTLRVALDKLW